MLKFITMLIKGGFKYTYYFVICFCYFKILLLSSDSQLFNANIHRKTWPVMPGGHYPLYHAGAVA